MGLRSESRAAANRTGRDQLRRNPRTVLRVVGSGPEEAQARTTPSRGTGQYRGSKATGHVVDTITSGKGSDEARISFQFDQVRLGNRTVPITTNLRAVASPHAVLEASPQPSSSEATDYEVEIGGDQISYAEGGPVIVGSQLVGKYTNLKPSFLPQV